MFIAIKHAKNTIIFYFSLFYFLLFFIFILKQIKFIAAGYVACMCVRAQSCNVETSEWGRKWPRKRESVVGKNNNTNDGHNALVDEIREIRDGGVGEQHKHTVWKLVGRKIKEA